MTDPPRPTPDDAALLRVLRRALAADARVDPCPQRCAGSITRCRDPLFDHVLFRPSPALTEQPHELSPAPPGRTGVRFAHAEFGGSVWYLAAVELEPGDDVYGTGEVAGPLRRTDSIAHIWTTDAFQYQRGTTPLYQAHPWALCLRRDGRSFGVLADTPARGLIASRRGELVMVFRDEPFRVYLLEGDGPGDVLRRLASITGRPPLPPRWALGYHQCRWSYEPDARVREVAAEFRARRIPCDAIWLDIDHMRGFRCFTFNPETFPDPRGLNRHLHDRGFRTVWMIDPGLKIDPEYPAYAQGLAGGHFVRDASGAVFAGSVWPGSCAFPDFTRARTRDWWANLVRDHLAHGIDGIWNDMNEPAVFDGPGKSMPESSLHDADGSLGGPGTHARYHNLFGMQMVRATREGMLRARPDERPFVLTRANFLGGHRYAATWTGDNTSSWEHLALSIPMALNLGLSGQVFAGPDIGGFDGEADGTLFARWMGVGALLPFARGHSIKDSRDHEPWSFGPACERVCRLALERRYRLLPCLYTLFFEASRDGMPVARPLFIADPSDASLRAADDSFLLGSDLLVRARTRESVPCLAPFPPGRWAPFEAASESEPELPDLFVREGAIVPLGPPIEHADQLAPDELTLVAHPDVSGKARCVLYEDDGHSRAHERGEHRLTLIELAPGGERAEVRVLEGNWPWPGARTLRVVRAEAGR